MEECNIVPPQQGRKKVAAKGYLMVKDKNRNDLFYWNCEKEVKYKCKGRASTTLNDVRHELRSGAAMSTTNKPLKIQSTNSQSDVSVNIIPHLPSNEAQRKKTKRMRVTRHHNTKPTSIEDLNILNELKKTLSQYPFPVKQSIVVNIELAAINVNSRYPKIKVVYCAWRKLHGFGLSIEYGNNEDFNIKVRQTMALAYLPPEEIPDEIKEIMPENANTDVPITFNHAEAWHWRWNAVTESVHIGLFCYCYGAAERAM
ncbi:Zinc finger, FLYWCH-type [Cinara cedri]|uniref:Zinc finger, FLYWCH-type n=1 Tax=Cinara cedri TaxID=506608 RepID=A0A5E4MGJ6_9HEMI|nr:Zinc finger, FLYWCH-type [Cinara cedri]